MYFLFCIVFLINTFNSSKFKTAFETSLFLVKAMFTGDHRKSCHKRMWCRNQLSLSFRWSWHYMAVWICEALPDAFIIRHWVYKYGPIWLEMLISLIRWFPSLTSRLLYIILVRYFVVLGVVVEWFSGAVPGVPDSNPGMGMELFILFSNSQLITFNEVHITLDSFVRWFHSKHVLSLSADRSRRHLKVVLSYPFSFVEIKKIKRWLCVQVRYHVEKTSALFVKNRVFFTNIVS